MAKKAPRSPILDELRRASVDEKSAVEFMEGHRWGDSPACPRCGSEDVYQMASRETGERNKDFRWRCRGCKKMHTVRTGTVMEETRLPMRAWCFAFWKACASKKGVSAMQISREAEISYKSALFLMHRIRHAMGQESDPQDKLRGTVEVDETFVGGKPRHRRPGKAGRRPYAESNKVPVVGLVERGGRARLRVMDRLTASRLAAALAEHVDLSSRLMTDEHGVYTKIGRRFRGGHGTTKHSAHEYVSKEDPTIHSNTIEGVFSLLKRGVYGNFHSVSRKHLPKYLNEFEFRWDTRYLNDGERVSAAIKSAVDKRLTYEDHLAS